MRIEINHITLINLNNILSKAEHGAVALTSYEIDSLNDLLGQGTDAMNKADREEAMATLTKNNRHGKGCKCA